MSYSQRQVMLSFAYAAYIDNLLTGASTPTLDAQIKTDLQNALSATANPVIPPVAGNWNVVWGPVTYTVPGSLYQDNMMYAVQLADPGTGAPPQYAVAVRGTNGTVLLDWLVDDLDIVQTMPWPLGASAADAVGNVSESASIGLTALVGMTDGVTGQTLQQFLASAIAAAGEATAATPASVCVTGHSLGGALAPALALYLRDNQSAWDPDGVCIVTTVSFAGPTAGDQAFATYFDQQFAYTGTSPLPFWMPADPSSPSYADCVRTSLDVAPLAWNVADMGTIEDIYTGHGLHDILAPLGTKEIVDAIVGATSANGYTQVQASQAPLPGTFVHASDLPPNHLPTSWPNLRAWAGEADYQHHVSYPTVLDVTSLLQLLSPAQSGSSPSLLSARQIAARVPIATAPATQPA
jgi:hypothetical protein